MDRCSTDTRLEGARVPNRFDDFVIPWAVFLDEGIDSP